MDLTLSEQQRALGASVEGVLRRRYDFAARKSLLGKPVGEAGGWKIWAEDLGLTGLRIAPAMAGQGGSGVDAMVVMEALGRRLVLEPFAECCIAAPVLLQGAGSRQALLAAIATEHLRVVPAFPEAGFGSDPALVLGRSGTSVRIDGTIRFVVGGPLADHFLIAGSWQDADDRRVILLIPADTPGLTRQDYRMVDGRAASDLRLDGVQVPESAIVCGPDSASPLLDHTRDAGIACQCAEALGVMREMIDLTADHVSHRRQFGATLSSFQVVQHRLADMVLALEKADAITLRASLMLDGDSDARSQAAAAAKVVTSEAVRLVGQSAVQLHGGTGTTEDAPISHYFRRATVIEGQFGHAIRHLDRFAAGFSRAA